MAFNIGLSGIRAASVDLEVTGNNVANASTIGFKESRAEFADVYTTTILGTGTKPVGSGVLVDNVRQEFSQGNISGTENALDMAIDGTGFFILNDNGIESYTRAGLFGLDKDGYVVANNNARLQGYEANGDGVVNGVLGDIQIRIGNQPPALTSRVSSILNLDASESVKQELGSTTSTTGLAVAVPDAGIADSTATILSTVGQATTAGTRTALTFDNGGVDLSAAAFVTVPADPGPFSFDIDPFDGTGLQTITIAAGVITVGATPTQHLQNILNAIQTELDTAFGNNEFEVTTNQSPLTSPLVSPTNLRIERAGFDATIGTSFSLTNGDAGFIAAFGDPVANTNLTTGVAGSQLFVGSNPLTADFRSIPGTSTTTRTTSTPPLAMTSFVAGDHAVLTSSITNGANIVMDLSGADSLVFDMEVTDTSGTTTTQTITLDNAALVALPAGNIAQVTQDEIRQVIAAQIGGGALAGLVNVSAGHPMTFTANTADNGDTIILVPNAASTNYDLSNIGYAASNRTATGTADIDANNEFRMQITGPTVAEDSSAYNIVIPTNTYATLDDLAAAIQTEIDLRTGANGLAGRVTVEAVGGQLVFTNTEVGAGYGVQFSQSTGLGAAEGLASLAALELDNPSVFLGTDEIDRANSFRITLTVPAPDVDGRSGTTTITLDEEYRSVQQVAASINRQISSLDSDAFIGVRAEAVEIVPNVVPPQYKLQFVATEDGEASTITVSDFIALGDDVTVDEMYGLIQIDEDDNSLLTQGIEGVNNEYPAQIVTLTDPDGNEIEIETEENAEANEIAAIYNRQAGVTASASSQLTIPLSGYNNPGNNMSLFLNGQELTSTSLPEIAEEINSLVGTTLPGFNAELNDDGDLIITNSIGRDIKVEISSPTVTDSIVVQGSENAGPVVLGGTATADVAAVVGGTVDIILNEGYTLSNPLPSVSGIFGALTADEFEDYVLNSFDPDDQNTYNHATSTTIYDSLGNSHIMTQFFVKEPVDPTRPNEENIWAMYVQIDGQEIGDPDSTLSFPENLEPTRLRYELFFNPDGTLDEDATGDLFVTNWDPINADGAPTGALKSLNVLEGGLPLTSPATNSNFQIFLDGSTQFGSPFSVAEVSQNGYTTGRLTGLEIDADGFIFARFTNGQAQVLGQVALASFKNPEGLVPLGDTAWGESFESGGPTVGSPRTGTFGNLRASALEESNVDLSEELVGLIIAQRNFQASAKTIETSDTVTQTIIQL
ncbi:MAG: flagellar hook-basal body complex protein [Gammaproteobacteria bacterium]|nr:flagellar hook-basal body complex protein [Gammaproteobacteria bacterium]